MIPTDVGPEAFLAGTCGFQPGPIRQRAQGLFAVVLTHFFADMVICALVYRAIAA